MALLFGAGLTITITITFYGFGIGVIGQTANLDQISVYMFLIAGITAFVFGLSQLKLFMLKLPTYSGTPKFIQNRGDVTYDLIDVTEKPEYLEKYPIFTAPGLVINEKLVFTGIPKIDELKKNFSTNR